MFSYAGVVFFKSNIIEVKVCYMELQQLIIIRSD